MIDRVFDELPLSSLCKEGCYILVWLTNDPKCMERAMLSPCGAVTYREFFRGKGIVHLTTAFWVKTTQGGAPLVPLSCPSRETFGCVHCVSGSFERLLVGRYGGDAPCAEKRNMDTDDAMCTEKRKVDTGDAPCAEKKRKVGTDDAPCAEKRKVGTGDAPCAEKKRKVDTDDATCAEKRNMDTDDAKEELLHRICQLNGPRRGESPAIAHHSCEPNVLPRVPFVVSTVSFHSRKPNCTEFSFLFV